MNEQDNLAACTSHTCPHALLPDMLLVLHQDSRPHLQHKRMPACQLPIGPAWSC